MDAQRRSAHRFSAVQMLRSGELESVRLHGRLEPVWSVQAERPNHFARMVRWVNHELEADAAWSLWQLSLRFGLQDVKARRLALRHAALGGWQIATSGCRALCSHLVASPELREAFEMGRALHSAVNHQITNGA